MLVVAPAASAATYDVRIQRGGFLPASLEIQAGDTVRWTNHIAPSPSARIRLPSNERQVLSENGIFASPILKYNETFSYTFTSPGTFVYFGAGRPELRGTVHVLAQGASVALADPVVVFGRETRLRGAVLSKRFGEQVTILEQRYGEAAPRAAAVLRTGPDGVFEFVVRPSVATSYWAEHQGVRSAQVTVQVRPIVTFVPARKGVFLAYASPVESFAGRSVLLQRRNDAGEWLTVASVLLGANAQASIALTRQRVATRYRIGVAAGEGFLEAWSGTQTVRRR